MNQKISSVLVENSGAQRTRRGDRPGLRGAAARHRMAEAGSARWASISMPESREAARRADLSQDGAGGKDRRRSQAGFAATTDFAPARAYAIVICVPTPLDGARQWT
jgi:hypothetical protein